MSPTHRDRLFFFQQWSPLPSILGKPVLQCAYLCVICSQSDELRLCQVDCLEKNLFHVRGMRLAWRPWLSLGQILEIFLQVFYLKYYIVCHPLDFDIEHVTVDSNECFKI